MKLKLCFLTPEQEKALEENTKYTGYDRDSLGLLVNAIFDLIHILEIYTLDNPDEMTSDEFLTMIQTLGRLIEPVKEFFSNTSGSSFGVEELEPEEQEA
jgi:hypothetical protein